MDIEAQIEQELLRMLAYEGPIKYDDTGVKIVGDAADAVWNSMNPVDKQNLVNAAYKFVIDVMTEQQK